MNIFSVSDNIENRVESERYDLFITASGYESRSRYVAENYKPSSERCVVLGFEEHRESCARSINDEFYRNNNFDYRCVSGNHSLKAERIYNRLVTGITNKEIKVLVDVTSMTRSWYGGIIKSMIASESIDRIEVDFVYSPARYTASIDAYPPNEVVGHVAGFSAISLPDLPSVLIIGIGKEKGRAVGLCGYLDPSRTIAFIPQSGIDVRYDDEAIEGNSDVLKHISEEDIYYYSVTDPLNAIKKLESVVLGCKREWRPVLATFGPKIFGLCCFLVASQYRDVSVWRVSAATSEDPVDRQAAGVITGLSTVWLA
ncbi:hypothetical protein BOW53_16085 [Solemya pervernicosa gill symbiont]|uniref:Uncharacterized protein n=1 Tax=Solemya pervernicosa gill symbiont TaxID=642797 RepID=A0A1T2KZJ8_9GAMM|nr:hypothetical protein [Solemya pervernicosa gill symbiont]OOZ38273.1 hypothetical protein BOW53_16085 [Solemya pervernicosa gill symbiont]